MSKVPTRSKKITCGIAGWFPGFSLRHKMVPPVTSCVVGTAGGLKKDGKVSDLRSAHGIKINVIHNYFKSITT